MATRFEHTLKTAVDCRDESFSKGPLSSSHGHSQEPHSGLMSPIIALLHNIKLGNFGLDFEKSSL